MISFGRNITAANDPLQKLPLASFYHAVRKPKPETVNMIRQLRIIRSLDIKQYKEQKKRLPYIVCAMFSPGFRNKENFAYTEYFIIDIDNLSGKNIEVEDMRRKIESDSRVVLCFVSPSEDGLKVMFKLDKRCYDAGVYSMFYKLFARQFSLQYGLEQVIDQRTSDVSRACFVSADSNVYFNQGADPVCIDKYVDENNSMEFFDIRRQLAAEEKKERKEQAMAQEKGAVKEDVDRSVIDNIKAILEPSAKRETEKTPVYVPEELNAIMGSLKEYIEQTGVQVTEIVSIQYGKKIRTKVGLRLAETNVFYGKRGFSVIISPRTGTNPELNDMIAQLIKNYLENY